jgi:hypothetical protein
MSQAERIAANEAWSRDINQRKADWLGDGALVAGFRCECWQMDCTDRIRLSGLEWQEVRSHPERFAVVPGHVGPDAADEEVVEEYPHFWIIEKRGEAKEVAEQLS